MTTSPRYLTGDAAGIQDFLDKFDVRTIWFYATFCVFKKHVLPKVRLLTSLGLPLRLRRSGPLPFLSLYDLRQLKNTETSLLA
jgi:hypothetical protein